MITREGGHIALGLTAGILLCIPVLLFLEIVTLPFALNDAILGAMVGGAIAGLVSLGAQWLVILDGIRRKDEEHLLGQKALAQSIFIKLHSLVDHVQKWRNYYWTYDSKHRVFINGAPRLFKPIFGSTFDFNLSVEENALLLDLSHSDLFNELGDLRRLSENLQMLHSLYHSKFATFQERNLQAGDVTVVEKNVSSEGPADPVGLLELEDILTHLKNTLRDGVPASQLALERIMLVLAENYSLSITMENKETISAVV